MTFYDSRDTGFGPFGWSFKLGPRGKHKVNLGTVWEQMADLFQQYGKFDPQNPEGWFSDGFIIVRSTGGDVRAVLELVRAESIPTREYGQGCR